MLKTVSSVINVLGALVYQGTWNASTNTPTLTSGVGVKGNYYVVSVAGSTNLDGETLWGVGDWAVFNGSAWQKVDGGDSGNLTNLTVTNDATIHGLTVGQGGGSVATNTVVGYQAGYSNTTGTGLTVFGTKAGLSNTSGNFNSFFGGIEGSYNYGAGYTNTTGSFNSAFGNGALANSNADSNSAFGYQTLFVNTSGTQSVAIGAFALRNSTTANNNTAVGYQSLYSNTASNNTAVGFQAGYFITTGIYNSILGGYNGNQGGLDIRTANNYIVLSDGQGNPRGIFDGSGSFLIGDYTAPSNAITTAAVSTKGQGTSGPRRATASAMGVTASLAQNATANTYSFGGYGGYGLFVCEGSDPSAAWRAAAIVWSTGAALTILNLGSSNITLGSTGTTITVTNTSASPEAIGWSMLVLG